MKDLIRIQRETSPIAIRNAPAYAGVALERQNATVYGGNYD